VQLSATGLPLSALAILISGTANLPNGIPFGDGVRCCGGQLIRAGLIAASGGMVTFPGTTSQADKISVASKACAGTTRCYQVYYRDPSGPCNVNFNVTNAYQIPWMP
jgi:hypothetical protein